MAERHGLEWFDRAILLIAIAPELDTRYERVYAFLQDDVTRRRPSVDLILNLLCGTAAEKMERRAHFDAASPLVRSRLIHLLPEPNQLEPPAIAHWVKVDEQAVREILNSGGMDSRLANCAEYVTRPVPLAGLPLEAAQIEGLRRIAFRVRAEGRPLRLHFRGAPMPLKRQTAEALASELGRTLLAVDIACASEPAQALAIAARQALLSNAILFVNAAGAAAEAEQQFMGGLEAALQRADVDVIVAQPTSASLEGLSFFPVDFEPASFDIRRQLWQQQCHAAEIELDAAQLDALAGLFKLYPDQVSSAVADARNRARWRGERQPNVEDLAAAARSQSSRQIDSLARKIVPAYGWGDIVLPSPTLAQLRALCSRVLHRHQVLDTWGFDRKLSMGKGATALFAGPSGTGKTMAAEIIARELGLELYKIDLSGIVSKFIGETEKNLERIFRAAEHANAILFFDEADALFGKRSEVRDSHDRYANIEVSYLLQKMEIYDGVAILASNLRQNLDESFVRRLAFTVHFPFPDVANRRSIWERIWPQEAPREDNLDLSSLAAKFKLSGGNIKNVALASSIHCGGSQVSHFDGTHSDGCRAGVPEDGQAALG